MKFEEALVAMREGKKVMPIRLLNEAAYTNSYFFIDEMFRLCAYDNVPDEDTGSNFKILPSLLSKWLFEEWAVVEWSAKKEIEEDEQSKR